jgi:hypothetical protein
MSKFKLAFEIARFVLFLVTSIKNLVLEAEEQLPESGKGSEKFAAVKKAVIIAAKYAEISEKAVDTVDGFIDEQINQTVEETINTYK